MPTVIEDVEVRLEFADLMRRVPLPRIACPDGFMELASREPGIHMSGILKPLSIAAKKLKPRDWDEESGEYPLLWALGVAWEEFVASLYPEMDYSPGWIKRDGIYMTCDGISAEAETANGLIEGPIIEEMKFTFTSSETPMLEQWMKLQQGMAYCFGYGARKVRWHRACVKGDYKKFGPVYKRTLVEFSEKEISKCWAMFVANKSLAVPE